MQDGWKRICKHKVKEQNKGLKKWPVLITKDTVSRTPFPAVSVCRSTDDLPAEDLAS